MANSDTSGAHGPAARSDDKVAVATAPLSASASGSGSGGETRTAPVDAAPGGPVHDRQPPAPIRAGSSRPSFLVMLLGGLIAGGIGYLAAYYTDFALFGSDDDLAAAVAVQEDRLDRIEAASSESGDTAARLTSSEEGMSRIEEQLAGIDAGASGTNERLAALEDALAALEPSGDPDFDPQALADLESSADQRIGDLASQVSDLTARVERLAEEVTADDGPSEEVTALQQRVEDLAAQVSAQDDAIAQAREDAMQEARVASVAGAIAQIRAAVDSGASFSEPVGTLQGVDAVEVPAALSDVAADGVATLDDLQNRFPDAARAALDASLSETAGDGALDRFGAFLAAQTGARSLGEREGAGPDAVLSRAQARVNEGDLDSALSEIEALPQSGQDAMSDWTSDARARIAARSAADDLAPPTNSN